MSTHADSDVTKEHVTEHILLLEIKMELSEISKLGQSLHIN